MRISVVSDVARFTAHMDEAAERQVPFALARALTWTAKDAQGDVQGGLPSRFTLRNSFLTNSIKIQPASKNDRPFAVVGATDRVAFMALQETGGTKHTRSGSRVAVPIKAKRNKRDIIPMGQRPGALRGKPKIFKVTSGSGAGIMRRVGRKRYPVEILYWLKHGVTVQPAFGFKGTTSETVSKRFGTNFVESLSQAMGHRG